jgi:hypothetical protein
MKSVKHRMIRLLDRFADLYPDTCKRLIGYSWQIFYDGKLEVVVISEAFGLRVPIVALKVAQNLLQSDPRRLSIRPVTGFAAIDTFEAYLVELEKQDGFELWKPLG